MTAPLLISAAGWLALGAMLGTLHVLTLRWNTRLFTAGGSLVAALAVQVGRLALLGAVLAAIAIRGGAAPLLLSAAGLLLARTVIVRRAARAP